MLAVNVTVDPEHMVVPPAEIAAVVIGSTVIVALPETVVEQDGEVWYATLTRLYIKVPARLMTAGTSVKVFAAISTV